MICSRDAKLRKGTDKPCQFMRWKIVGTFSMVLHKIFKGFAMTNLEVWFGIVKVLGRVTSAPYYCAHGEPFVLFCTSRKLEYKRGRFVSVLVILFFADTCHPHIIRKPAFRNTPSLFKALTGVDAYTKKRNKYSNKKRPNWCSHSNLYN